jgi:integrase/recombinase XerD
MAKAKTLNKAELKRMPNYIDAHERYRERSRAMILFTYLCGMRIRELVKLKVSDVIDYINKVKTEIKLSKKQTKGKQALTVFVSKRMRKELDRYIKHAVIRFSGGFIFKTQKSQRFSSNTATQLLQRIYERSGLSGATSHSGRRTFITELAAKGVSVRVLAALVGH